METSTTVLESIQQRIDEKFSNTRFAWLARLFFSPIFWVLLFAVLRYCMEPVPYRLQGDTATYIRHSANILKGETDITRTPVYPDFIRLIEFVTGGEPICLKYSNRASVDQMPDCEIICTQGEVACVWIVRFQYLIFLCSLACVYKAGKMIFRNPWFLAFALIMGVHCFYCYQFDIMTEGLSISMVGFFLALMIWYLKKPRWELAVGASVCVLLMSFLRPALLYILILLILFWILRLICPRRDRMPATVGLLCSLVVVALVLGYCGLNLRNHNLFTISEIGRINQFLVLLDADFHKRGNDSEIIQDIEDIGRNLPKEDGLWALYVFDKLEDKYGSERVFEFTHKTIQGNRVAFTLESLKRISVLRPLYRLNFYLVFGFIEFILTLSLWLLLKRIPWNRLVLWGLFYGLFFVVLTCAPRETPRLLSPASFVAFIIAARLLDLFCVAYYCLQDELKTYLTDTL